MGKKKKKKGGRIIWGCSSSERSTGGARDGAADGRRRKRGGILRGWNMGHYHLSRNRDDDLDRVYRETYTTSDVTNQQYNNEGIYIHGFGECNAITLKLGDKTNGTQCRFSQRQQRIGSIMTTKKDGKKEKRRSRMMMMKKVKTVVDGPTLTFAFPNYSNNSHNGNNNNNNNTNTNTNTNTNNTNTNNI